MRNMPVDIPNCNFIFHSHSCSVRKIKMKSRSKNIKKRRTVWPTSRLFKNENIHRMDTGWWLKKVKFPFNRWRWLRCPSLLHCGEWSNRKCREAIFETGTITKSCFFLDIEFRPVPHAFSSSNIHYTIHFTIFTTHNAWDKPKRVGVCFNVFSSLVI